MYALFVLVDLIRTHFPEKKIPAIGRSVRLTEDLKFDRAELLKLYRMIKERFGVTVFPEKRFEILGALADYIEDRW